MRRLAALAAVAMLVGAPAAAGATPKVEQMVVFRDGSAVSKTVSSAASRVKVGQRSCVVPRGTALAALARSKPGRLRVRDFGSCSARPRDAAGLFVRSIRGESNRGENGWVYKVGRRAATAGAADPGGPFGRGRLRAGRPITWFYCQLRDGGCQRTLELDVTAEPGALRATVRGYDDQGDGVPVAGATIHAGTATATTDAAGTARLALPAGRYRTFAEAPGLVRSFTERVEVP